MDWGVLGTLGVLGIFQRATSQVTISQVATSQVTISQVATSQMCNFRSGNFLKVW